MGINSLTLSDEELSKWYIGFNQRPGWKPSTSIQSGRVRTASDPAAELRQFGAQVSDFFGNLYKGVKTTTDDLIKEINTPPPSHPFSPDSVPPSATSPNMPDPVTSVEDRQKAREEREAYELELAIAMSLSEATTNNSISDIEKFSHSPTKPSFENEEEILAKTVELSLQEGKQAKASEKQSSSKE